MKKILYIPVTIFFVAMIGSTIIFIVSALNEEYAKSLLHIVFMCSDGLVGAVLLGFIKN